MKNYALSITHSLQAKRAKLVSALRITHYILLLFLLASCVDVDEYPDTPNGNFEAL